MALLVHLQQLFEIQVRVFLCRGQAFMAEELLYGTQVRSAAEKVGGKGMSQGMRADLTFQCRLLQVAVDRTLNRSGAEPAAPIV